MKTFFKISIIAFSFFSFAFFIAPQFVIAQSAQSVYFQFGSPQPNSEPTYEYYCLHNNTTSNIDDDFVTDTINDGKSFGSREQCRNAGCEQLGYNTYCLEVTIFRPNTIGSGGGVVVEGTSGGLPGAFYCRNLPGYYWDNSKGFCVRVKDGLEQKIEQDKCSLFDGVYDSGSGRCTPPSIPASASLCLADKGEVFDAKKGDCVLSPQNQKIVNEKVGTLEEKLKEAETECAKFGSDKVIVDIDKFKAGEANPCTPWSPVRDQVKFDALNNFKNNYITSCKNGELIACNNIKTEINLKDSDILPVLKQRSGSFVLPYAGIGNVFNQPSNAINVNVEHTLINILNFLLYIVSLLAVAMMIYSGWLFMTSEGDPTKLTTAKQYLIWTIFGLAVAAVSFSITNIVNGFLAQ